MASAVAMGRIKARYLMLCRTVKKVAAMKRLWISLETGQQAVEHGRGGGEQFIIIAKRFA
jgi:hypothetical protein